MQQVSVRRMDKGTQTDYELLSRSEDEFIAALPDRILVALGNLEKSLARYQFSSLEHSLQPATRAERDGADVEMIMRVLIHNLGDDLAPSNHFQRAEAIIRSFVRSEVTGIIEHHGIFQTYYCGDARSVDKNAREIFFTTTV